MLTVLECKVIIKKYQTVLPINLLAIAGELGLKIYEVSNWDINLSGKIIRDTSSGSPSGYIIYINAKHPFVRKRFTIAHEIAHFIYHKEFIGDGIVDDGLYRSDLSNEQEAMANKVAAEILMPASVLREEAIRSKGSIDELAKKFEVSQAAMAIRLGSPC